MKTTVLSLLMLASSVCLAQQPVPPSAFQVASVRITDATIRVGPPLQTTANSLTIHSLSLKDCIQTAWQLPPEQVSGPGWLNDVRLEIAAKTSGPVDEQQLYLMLRTLLAERFGVKTHIDKRETATYALTVTKSGPKFAESPDDGPAAIRNEPNNKKGLDHFGMAELAVLLTRMLGRPVTYATGLKGHYNLHLDLTPFAPVPGPDGSASAPPDPVSMMITLLQEQLGLKVESRKDSVDFLIVDHAEKTPTEN